MYLGGEGIGEASDRLLFGEANPGGRLAETFPISSGSKPELPEFPGDGRTVLYGEDIFVGYRYYDGEESTGALGIRPWTVIYGIQLQQYETLFCGNERWRYSEGEH